MLQLNEQECWQLSEGLTRIVSSSIDELRHTIFEVLEEIAPFDCGVSYVVRNEADVKRCLEPMAYRKGKVVPSVPTLLKAAELAHKSSAYNSFEWQKKSLIFRDSDMFSKEFMTQTEIGRMINEELGMSYACKIFLVHNDILVGKFWLLRRKERGDFNDKDLFRLRLLEPLITRAMYKYHPQNEQGLLAKKILKENFGLTERERQITALICRGMSNKQIADKLICAEATVKKHITAIAKKMAVSSRSEIFHRCVVEKAVPNFI